MKEPTSVSAEVIVHELLDLKVPNYGKILQALLRPFLGYHTGKVLDGTYEPAIPTLTIVMRVLSLRHSSPVILTTNFFQQYSILRDRGFVRDLFGQYRLVWHGCKTSAGF